MANHHHLARCVEEFLELDKGMTLFQMQFFLLVATNEGQSQKWIEDKMNTSNATVSRTLARWSEFETAGRRGLGMVQTEQDPQDRRFRIVSLTPKGRAFLKVIQQKLGDDNGDQTRKKVAS